jgi:hypothetical protein
MDGNKMDVTPDCSPEVLMETINFMYGKEIKEQVDNFAGLLDAAERFMMDDFKIEIGKRMVNKVKLNTCNYMETCTIADRYRLHVVASMCARYIHYEASSAAVDWEAMKSSPLITASSMMLLKTKLESMKGYNGCINGKVTANRHICNHIVSPTNHSLSPSHTSQLHTCSTAFITGAKHVCSVSYYGTSHECNYTGPPVCTSCCAYTKVIAQDGVNYKR